MPAMGSHEPGTPAHDHLLFWVAASIVAMGVIVVVTLLVAPAPATTTVGTESAEHSEAPANSTAAIETTNACLSAMVLLLLPGWENDERG